MDQRISLVTLGVADVARSKRFYEGLGWSGQEVEDTVFFQAGGMAVVLWGRDKLAEDGGIDDDTGARFGGVGLALNVGSRDEVDRVIAEADAAGAQVTKPPAETFYGGYAAYFRDPDGHAWEVAHNPSFTLNADGTITLPDFFAG